jgi:glycosyltransferase involved in cell wall biosynthesis
VICSHRARSAEVNDLLAARNFTRAIVIDLPPGYTHPALDFETSKLDRFGLPAAYINPNVNLSTKRNLGLLLARMLGWERVFFLDDDIRDLNSADLRATTSMLGLYRAVGMRAIDFPDNSVVCHGHRRTGGQQDVFISGSVLAVHCAEQVAFFPEIYNEDWFFFYHYAAARRLAWSGRDATQLCYDPFADPRRAAGQEFGDVMAEGLFSLLHHRIGEGDATGDYWRTFLAARMRFLEAVLSRAGSVEPYLRRRIVSSVVTAMAQSRQIKPIMCEHYLKLWKQDLGDWQQRLTDLPTRLPVKTALSKLSLTASGRSPYMLAGIFGARAEGASRNVTAGHGLIPPGSASGMDGRIDSILVPQGLDTITNGGGYLPFAPDSPADGPEGALLAGEGVSRMSKRADDLVRRVRVLEERSEPVDSSLNLQGGRFPSGKHRKAHEPDYAPLPVNVADAGAGRPSFPAHMSPAYVPSPSAAPSAAGR